MAGRTDDELIAIVTGPVGDWEPEALEAAETEIARRGLRFERPALPAIEAQASKAEARASVPLDARMKVVALLVGVFLTLLGIAIGLAVKASWTRRGDRQKGSDFLLWTIVGTAVAFVLYLFVRS